MSKELTIEIMEMFKENTSVQSVIAFVERTTAITTEEETEFAEFLKNLEISEDIVLDSMNDLNKLVLEDEDAAEDIDVKSLYMYMNCNMLHVIIALSKK